VKRLTWSERENVVVCLAGGRDAIGKTMLQGFNVLAELLGGNEAFKNWSFSLSPGILQSEEKDEISGRVRRMSSLDEPWDLLCTVRALAVITPLGFGFKTTIVDALAAGCHVFVHPTVARRLPGNLRSHCIEFSPDKSVDISALVQKLNEEPQGRYINQDLFAQAERELKRAFSIQ
jgi:hypothetical protein